MPVEYCTSCRSRRLMHRAVSRVQVRPASGKTVEVVTATFSCRSCGTLLLRGPAGMESAPPTRRAHTASVRKSPHLAMLLLACLLVWSCSTVPVTKRHQLDLIPAGTMLPMSFNSYKDFLSKHKVIENTPEADMVKRVGVRIQHAVETYMAQNKMSDRLKGYAWEFHLVDDKQVNAWCMPGGKVVVYSGLIPVARDETGLAVVLGHEISHAVAKHGDERMSQGLIAEMGGIALEAALAQKPAQTQQLFMAAYGAGAQVGVLLPYSRVQESEADHLGLIFMAMAGYDPRQAVPFWERMIQSQQGGAPPELLSTHPADKKRIADIEKEMPEAMKYYKP